MTNGETRQIVIRRAGAHGSSYRTSETIRISAEVHGDLAIVKLPRFWSVTHVRSGTALWFTRTKREAVAALRQLSDIDWSRSYTATGKDAVAKQRVKEVFGL